MTREKYEKQFAITKEEIDKFNSRNNSAFKQGINSFAHVRYVEATRNNLGLRMPLFGVPPSSRPSPYKCDIKSFDWRRRGAVTAV